MTVVLVKTTSPFDDSLFLLTLIFKVSLCVECIHDYFKIDLYFGSSIFTPLVLNLKDEIDVYFIGCFQTFLHIKETE